MTDQANGTGARGRFGRGIAELLIIFVGVTAAFLVEGYRDELDQYERLRQVTDGLITELSSHELKTKEHADSIAHRIGAWASAAAAGHRTIPGFYHMRGGQHPPTAGWEAAVSSGVAGLFEPTLQLELGYYYSELVGVHDNYVRRLEFIEREILPRTKVGPEAFYDSMGQLLPQFDVEMDLLADFGHDLNRLRE